MGVDIHHVRKLSSLKETHNSCGGDVFGNFESFVI